MKVEVRFFPGVKADLDDKKRDPNHVYFLHATNEKRWDGSRLPINPFLGGVDFGKGFYTFKLGTKRKLSEIQTAILWAQKGAHEDGLLWGYILLFKITKRKYFNLRKLAVNLV